MIDRLKQILDSIVGRRVLVVGDVMLDEYLWGGARRISPEAPVIVVEVQQETHTPGGAANVAKNIQALGGQAVLIGVIGDDEAGNTLRSQLIQIGVDVSGIVVDSSRPTTRKTRVIAHNQQIVRVDREICNKLSARATQHVIARLLEFVKSSEVVVFSDYDKGMAVKAVIQAFIEQANQYSKRVIVNPKPRNLKQFKSVTLISMNQSELEAATGIVTADERGLLRAAKRILYNIQPYALLVTLGPLGMRLFISPSRMYVFPAHLVEVYDVAGAGDTVVSVLALALAAGASFQEAVTLANSAGGAVVRKVGVATVTRDEILTLISETPT